jgi:pilus assembly protein CpaB
MRPARIILLLVALIAGGLAAFFATRGNAPAPAPQVAEIVQEPRTQILVASAPIGMAERLGPGNVEWVDWPESALRDDYVTISAMPDAPTDLEGAVARFEFFPGEPIREVKLVRADQGYLSAVLAQGKRGVSIPVESESASGGFIVPNDRVDVILTRDGVSQTVLQNVRVLAIGKRLGEVGTTGGQEDSEEPAGRGFSSDTIATLELDPGQGETLINAGELGSLSLALRSMADFNEPPDTRRSNNQPIRVIGFGNTRSVIAGAGDASNNSGTPATVDPASYIEPEPEPFVPVGEVSPGLPPVPPAE